jgi:Uncharacterised nucleotidyltransferase
MRPYPIGNGTLSPRVPREFAALMDALQCEGANMDALLALDHADWPRLLEFCDLAHLSLSLAQLDLAGVPKWVAHRLEQNVSDNSRRFEFVHAAYTEATSALTQAGVSHVVLKGFTQAPHYVSDARLRYQSDIDLYCLQDQIEVAQAALAAIGYQPVEGTDYSAADHVPTLSRPGHWQWRGNPYDPEMPPSIELHFTLWNEDVSLIELPEVQRFRERFVTRRLGREEYASLSPVDHLGYFALHIVRGVFSGDWVIHHVFELATFLHSHARDLEFWNQWYETHSMNLRRCEVIAFCLARSWFSCTLPEVVRTEADQLAETQKHWLDRFGGGPLEVMFRRNKDGRLLQLLMATRPQARQSVLRKALLPPPIPSLNGPMVLIENRRAQRSRSANRYISYSAYLGRKVLNYAGSNMLFLIHSMALWLSSRALSRQFWLFLGASFFLTWACPSSSSSSTCS